LKRIGHTEKISKPIDADDRSAPLMVFNQTRNQKPETRNFFLLVALALIVLTLVVFWPVGRNDFVNYDDDLYITTNAPIQQGLTIQGILWAFRSTRAGNWHPVTWLSHMLDVSLFGMNPAGHHWMNLLFHLANVLLLFFLLKRMTDALWPSAFVAALFAIHPLHVESVAWVAERKDVLSAFFGLLTLWAYVGYTENKVSSFKFQVSSLQPEDRKAMLDYLGVLVFFTLGLMAKPMLVTLPFLMLLLDYWPLKRVSSFKFPVSSLKPGTRNQKPETRTLFFEKLPLFALAAASSVITYLVQHKGGATAMIVKTSIGARLGNALVSYVLYLWKMIWPFNLAVLYPHPGGLLPLWQIFGSALLLSALSLWVLRQAKRRPYLMVGWLWYLGTLVPVIGIVQVGAQAMADRYTYLPLIGIFIMIAWGAAETRNLKPETFRTVFLGGIAGIALVLLAATARTQVGYWKDGVTLFKHAVEVTEMNIIAHTNLGVALFEQGKVEEAIKEYSEALAIQPNFAKAHNNLGVALAKQGKPEEASRHYREAMRPTFFEPYGNLAAIQMEQGKTEEAIENYAEAIRIKPDYFDGHIDLGIALGRLGKVEEAIGHYLAALRIKPDSMRAHFNLAEALAKQGKAEEAIQHYSEALRVDPEVAEAHNGLGLIFAGRGRIEEAIGHYSEAIRLKPDYSEAHYNLATALAGQGKLEEAAKRYSEALRIYPDYFEAHSNLAAILAQQGRLDEAVRHYSEALSIKPDHERLHFNLGLALAKQGKVAEAIAHFSEAVRIKPDDPLLRYNLGIVYENLGRKKDASGAFEAALRIKPDFAEAKKKLENLNKK
jgi:tetratricopeptide (TPR) repeat protein